jgi:hypothetical protein
MVSMLSTAAMALLLNGCGDQREVSADPARKTENVTDLAKPLWASVVGRDQYGFWADLIVNGVTQRFRFIPKVQIPAQNG